MWVQLLRAVVYRGKKYDKGEVIEVGDDLGNRMVAAGQALPSKPPREPQEPLGSLTKVQLEERCKELGIEGCAKMKKAEIIELLKTKGA